MKRANLFLLILCCILLNHAANATLTATTTIANCNQQGSISLSSTFGSVTSFYYAGTSSGAVTGSAVNLNCGMYSVTVTLNNGATETTTNIIVDHEDHIQLKNWYLTGNIPSTSVNWGATIDNPRMTGWTGITTSGNGCISKVILNDLNITGSIPNFNLPSLYDLRLSNNQLSGTIPNFNLPSVAIIVLNTNQLSGTIPNFNLPNLISLTLTYNQFSGGIPKFNNNLNIESLYLGYNQLNDTIPNFNLPKLKILNLRNNQLSGTIPNFNFSPNLSNLILNNNQLSGNIPAFTAQNFDILSLEYNQLTGTIPNFNFSKIFDLRLSNNQLSGSIPNFNLPKLSNLYLGNNQLTGSIPKFNMPYLGFLYLQNNQLSGCIPIEIKYNSPFIKATGGSVSNNPSLNTQSWSNYWNSNTGACPAAILNGKVFLNSVNSTTGLMDNYVKTLASFPTTDPYSYHPLDTVFKHVNNPIVAQVPTSTLSVTGNNSIVDWVFLELRNGTSSSTSVAYTKSALLQKDGDIVGMNGTSPVIFDNTTPGNYYVTVRHRNHLGFRTANPIALSLTPTTLNFTNNSVPLYGATPLTALSTSLFAMNGGDANFDGSIDALDSIKWEQQNGLFDEYTNNADYNLDGSVDAFDSILWELNNGKYQELD